jgi:hypothetical protein
VVVTHPTTGKPTSSVPEDGRTLDEEVGMAEGTDADVLNARVDAERRRRAEPTATGDWRDAEVPAADEPWLFPGEDGLPPTGEHFNDACAARPSSPS